MHELRERVLGSLAWSGAGQAVRQVLTLVIVVVLARLMGPEEFGLFAMLAVFTGFAEVFLELGLGSALVQRSRLGERHRSTVFWVTLAVGLGLAALWIALTPLVARLYGTPALAPLAWPLSACFLFGALRCVPQALLVRAMHFRRLAIMETIAGLVGGGVAIGMAMDGAGAEALVFQVVVRTALLSALVWVGAGWRPRRLVSRRALRDVWPFGSRLIAFRLSSYWSTRLDQPCIGVVIGAGPLGAYTKAQELVLLPLRQINAAVSRVMFPALSSIQNDPRRVRRVYLRALGVIALLTAPLMLGIAVIAEPLVLALLGEQWRPTVPLLCLLCVGGVGQALGVTTGWIFLSQGRTDLMFRWSLLAMGVRLVAVLVGLPWGILGVVISRVAFDTVVLMYPAFAVPGRLIGMSARDAAGVIRGPLVCASIMAAVVFGAGRLLPADVTPWSRLGLLIPLGVVLYAGLIHAARLRPWLEVLELTLGRRRRAVLSAAEVSP